MIKNGINYSGIKFSTFSILNILNFPAFCNWVGSFWTVFLDTNTIFILLASFVWRTPQHQADSIPESHLRQYSLKSSELLVSHMPFFTHDHHACVRKLIHGHSYLYVIPLNFLHIFSVIQSPVYQKLNAIQLVRTTHKQLYFKVFDAFQSNHIVLERFWLLISVIHQLYDCQNLWNCKQIVSS